MAGSRVTNRVGPDALGELLGAARAGVLAYADARGAVQALPVAVRWRGGSFRVGVPGGLVGSGTRVAVEVDRGAFWWELQAVLGRGTLSPGEPPGGDARGGLDWFEVKPDRVTAWDYGRLRAET